jgi:hypothetical protein
MNTENTKTNSKKVRRLTIALGLVALSFYLGFILMQAMRG